MPKMGNIGVANAAAFGYSTSVGATYYVAYYNTTTAQSVYYPTSIAVTPDNFLYIAGISGSSTRGLTAIALDSNGNIAFQNKYTTIASNMNGAQVTSDGSLVAVGAYASTGYYNSLFKFSRSGAFLGACGINSISSNTGNTNVFIDSSGNYHTIGNYGTATYVDGLYTKFDSSLSLVSQSRIYVPTTITSFVGITGDSSGNIYLAGYIVIASVYYVFLIKLDNTGAISWQYKYQIGSTSTINWANPILDSSGNIYLYSQISGTNTSLVILKVDSTGALVWCKQVSISGQSLTGYTFKLDPQQNYLYANFIAGTASNKCAVAKFDLSGNLIWARSVSNAATGLNSLSATVNANAVYYFYGATVSSNIKGFVACFPTDGTKTGTYSVGGQSVTYASETMTVASITPTRTTQTFTKTASAYASGSGLSLTPTGIGATLSTTIIP